MCHNTDLPQDSQEAPRQSYRAARTAADERQFQGMTKMACLVLLLVGALYAYSLVAPKSAQQPAFYYPDPTPFVVHNEYNFLSKNQICIGINQCN